MRYDIIKKILNSLKLKRENIFVDIGCGKGRILFLVATENIKKIVGIELRKKLVDIAKKI